MWELTPFRVAFAAALACLLPLPVLLAAPVNTYASAIALEELAKAATAEAYLCRCRRISLSRRRIDNFFASKLEFEIEVVDVSSEMRDGLNELKRRLYLSSDPWEPFRGYYFLAGCCWSWMSTIELVDSEK